MRDKLKKYWWIIAIIIFAMSYASWLKWFRKPPPSNTAFSQVEPAISHEKTEGPLLKAPIRVVPKSAVKKKFPEAQIKDDEEWIDTAEVPPTENGGVMLTKIDTVTGDSTSQFKANESPWFSFEGKNYVGIGFDTTQQGKLYYKRDFLRVKDLHLQGETQIRGGKDKVEAFAGANLEYRF